MAESLKKVRKAKSAGSLLSAILDLGKAMITCGGEIWRVEETLGMMLETYCFKEYDIHFAASKKHLGLYPGGEATTVFADKLESFDVSKGTIRLPYNKPLPKDLIAEIAQWCYKQYAK